MYTNHMYISVCGKSSNISLHFLSRMIWACVLSRSLYSCSLLRHVANGDSVHGHDAAHEGGGYFCRVIREPGDITTHYHSDALVALLNCHDPPQCIKLAQLAEMKLVDQLEYKLSKWDVTLLTRAPLLNQCLDLHVHV